MKNNSNFTKFIIVLGTTKSGSGAIFDYLVGRGDINDPLRGQEYHLPQMPNGLMALESVSKKAFHPGTADYVLSQFEDMVKILSRPQTRWHYGMDYESRIPLFKESIKIFIDEICSAKLPMRLHWRKITQDQSPLIYLFSKLKNRLGFNELVHNSRLIVSPDELIIAAQKLHNRLFENNNHMQPTLLNQAGSGWNPINSTKYFENRKIILSTRDPRDQFAELKQLKKATSVNGFIDWYKEMQRHIENISDPSLLHLRFEEFINVNQKSVVSLCQHVSLDSKISSNYDPNSSEKNIGKFKKILNLKEINSIEKKLSEYLYLEK